MVEPTEGPSIKENDPLLKLEIPPVAIVLICFAGYFLILFIFILVRYCVRSKGSYSKDFCSCNADIDCCQCLAGCADACSCRTPTIETCLDSCCPKRNLDLVSIILCQCCGTPDNPSCANCNGPCCTYGELNCNCACIQPDLDSINCLCCQIGSNYNRADDE